MSKERKRLHASKHILAYSHPPTQPSATPPARSPAHLLSPLLYVGGGGGEQLRIDGAEATCVHACVYVGLVYGWSEREE